MRGAPSVVGSVGLGLLLGLGGGPFACGKPTPAPVTPQGQGTLTGPGGFTVISALAAHRNGAGGIEAATAFFLTDQATNCDEATPTDSVPYGNATLVGLVLATQDDALLVGSIPVAANPNDAGYPDGGPRLVVANVGLKRADGTSAWASSGRLAFTDATANHLAGTLDLMLQPDGGAPSHLSGTFEAPVCPGLTIPL